MDLTDEQKQAWIARHLANAPERDEAWLEGVRRIYAEGRREAAAEQQPLPSVQRGNLPSRTAVERPQRMHQPPEALVRLSDIRSMIENSTNDDWHHIPCWGHGAGPSYRERWSKFTGPGDKWELDHDSHPHVLVYRDDVQLSISWGLGMNNAEPKASPQWLEHFPMVENVDYFAADIFWNGSLVDRHDLVAFDQGRHYLPAPTAAYSHEGEETRLDRYKVTRWHVGLARLLHQVEHVNEFDEALRRAGFEVVTA